MFSKITSKFTKDDFLSIRDFVRLQYEKTAKYQHHILRFIAGMEISMMILGYFNYNHSNPRYLPYMTLYFLLAAASIFTDIVVKNAEKKGILKISKALSRVGYFYFAFIVAWGLAITTLDVTRGGTYWVAATVIMSIAIFLNLNPFYTSGVVTLAGIYLMGLNYYVKGRVTAGLINVAIYTLIVCIIIFKNYFAMYENYYMEYKLEQLSLRDGLTGVNNRRAFENVEDGQTDYVKCVAIVDIDDFKLINDCKGHQAGDEALLRVTSVFREYFKDKEIYRYGGDEFVFLSGCSAYETAKRLEKVNQRLAESANSYSLHISGGIMTRVEGKSINEILSVADGLLYEAKKEGKKKIKAA